MNSNGFPRLFDVALFFVATASPARYLAYTLRQPTRNTPVNAILIATNVVSGKCPFNRLRTSNPEGIPVIHADAAVFSGDSIARLVYPPSRTDAPTHPTMNGAAVPSESTRDSASW